MKATHSLRYECQADLVNMLANALDYCREHQARLILVVIEAEENFAHFLSDLTLEGLRELLRTAVDGHVMVQTADYADAFTGERDYDIPDDFSRSESPRMNRKDVERPTTPART